MFWSGGFIYLLENQGDPFHDYTNAREKGEFRFADILWYLIITASTIGYGDYFPVTDLGKIFAIFYISSKLNKVYYIHVYLPDKHSDMHNIMLLI